jgi:peptidoglycan/xylan/chitin deacetylase (PgdA/CDA1 family)
MTDVRRLVLHAVGLPGVAGALSTLLRDRAVIFMMHRVRQPELGVEGHDPADLRRLLAHLRRQRYELVSLEEVFRRLAGQGPRPGGCVAFTLDDGYADQVELAGPCFAEFDCPATTFVTTGFLDRALWFWWDRIDWVFRRTARSELALELGDREVRYAWSDRAGRDRARDAFTAACKQVRDEAKHHAIARLAERAGVELPERAPDAYAPMSWEQLRAWERRGMRFGPHTVTHPVLSRLDDDQSKRELVDGWARLRAEASSPTAVFCYPNGQWGDFGAREIATLRELGMLGAVVGAPGYASARRFARGEAAPFEVLRFSLPETLADLVQVVSGFERVKQIVRREDAA